MLHKLDGFIWLDAVSVDCYSNALQHNGPGTSLQDTVAHIHSRAQKKQQKTKKTQSGTTCSQELGNSNSNEKNSQEAGTGLTNILFPPSQAKKPTSGPFSPPLQWTRTHIYTFRHTQRALKIPVLIIAGGKRD